MLFGDRPPAFRFPTARSAEARSKNMPTVGPIFFVSSPLGRRPTATMDRALARHPAHGHQHADGHGDDQPGRVAHRHRRPLTPTATCARIAQYPDSHLAALAVTRHI